MYLHHHLEVEGKNEGGNMTETKISPESGWTESDCSINYVDLLSPECWSRPRGIIHLVPLHNQDLVSKIKCKKLFQLVVKIFKEALQ